MNADLYLNQLSAMENLSKHCTLPEPELKAPRRTPSNGTPSNGTPSRKTKKAPNFLSEEGVLSPKSMQTGERLEMVTQNTNL